MTTTPLIVEKTIQAPAKKIWKALTDRDQMKQWYFEVDSFKPEVGFEFSFKGENEGKVYIHHCKITEVIPNKKLSYTWKYEAYPGSSHVTFELIEKGDSTIVKLTHEGLESFPSDLPDFARESFTTGWEYIIGTALKDFAEKG